MINNSHAAWRRAEFRKSSFSGGEAGSCVELAWRKSSFSGGASGSCVEIARGADLFGVRDSKNADGPVLQLSAQHGHALVAAVRTGRLGR